jgi:7,8-dihydroneopterin aldolase/epimerase/oxygenase
MGKITLEGLHFFAHHGFYEEEKKTGNNFIVDVIIETEFSQKSIKEDEISGTIDYEKVYELIKEQMNITSKLLENAAWRILDNIYTHSKGIKKIEVKICKLNPPINGKADKICVSISK